MKLPTAASGAVTMSLAAINTVELDKRYEDRMIFQKLLQLNEQTVTAHQYCGRAFKDTGLRITRRNLPGLYCMSLDNHVPCCSGVLSLSLLFQNIN